MKPSELTIIFPDDVIDSVLVIISQINKFRSTNLKDLVKKIH